MANRVINRSLSAGSQRSVANNPLNDSGRSNSRGEILRKEAVLVQKTGIPTKRINSDVAENVLKRETRQRTDVNSRSRGGSRSNTPTPAPTAPPKPMKGGENQEGLPNEDDTPVSVTPTRSNAGVDGRVRGESFVRSGSNFRLNPDGSKTLFTLGPRITRGGNEYDQMQTKADRVRSNTPITSKQQIRDMQNNPELYQQPIQGFSGGGGFMSSIPWMPILIGAGLLILFNILSKRKK